MSNDTRRIVITGATGNQGGAVLRHLLGTGFELVAMTRNPESARARELVELGVGLVRGDLDDEASLRQALTGAWGVFAVQNTWEAGVVAEEEQGKRIARVAREVGVEHFVYTSVGSAHRGTGIPHFDNKWRVEGTIRALDFPSHVIIRPVFFMENLLTPWFLNGDHLVAAMKPDTPLQMIAVEDIGRVGARAFVDHERLNGREIDLATDEVTLQRAAEEVSRILGRNITFQPIPIDAVRAQSEDFAAMLEWFEDVGYNADIDGVFDELGLRPTSLERWADHQIEAASMRRAAK